MLGRERETAGEGLCSVEREKANEMGTSAAGWQGDELAEKERSEERERERGTGRRGSRVG